MYHQAIDNCANKYIFLRNEIKIKIIIKLIVVTSSITINILNISQKLHYYDMDKYRSSFMLFCRVKMFILHEQGSVIFFFL
jgi:hypothetical protein